MTFNISRFFVAMTLCAATSALAQNTTTTPPTTAAKPAVATTSAATKETKSNHAGKVWVNLDSKIYHCEGDRHFGTTKNGDYMTLAEAKAQGMTAAKNSKNCKE